MLRLPKQPLRPSCQTGDAAHSQPPAHSTHVICEAQDEYKRYRQNRKTVIILYCLTNDHSLGNVMKLAEREAGRGCA